MLSSLNLKLKVCFKKFRDVNYRRGVSTLVGACFINFLAGAIFSLCTLSVYEISYIKAKGGSITIDHLTFYYPIEIIFQCVSAFFSGNIYTKFGLHITNLIGTTVLTLGYFTMFISSSLFLDLLAMIIGGIGTGIIFYPSTTNAYEWFKEHNGIIVGIMETMISFGSFFFAFIGEKIINKEEVPSNDKDNLYDFEIGKRIKLYLIIQMISLISAFIISYILMYVKKEDEDILEDIQDNSHIINNDIQTKEHTENEDINKKEVNEKNNVKKSESETDKDNEDIDTLKVSADEQKEEITDSIKEKKDANGNEDFGKEKTIKDIKENGNIKKDNENEIQNENKEENKEIKDLEKSMENDENEKKENKEKKEI